MESRGEVRGSKRGRKKNGEKGWRGSEILRKNLSRTVSRTMEYALYLGNFFSYPRFQFFFFIVVCLELAFHKDWNQFALLWKDSRDSRSSFFFWNKREKGRSKDTSGTKGRRILFFLSEEVKDFRARIRQIWGRSWKIYKSSYLTFFVVPSSWPSFSDDGCRLKRRRNWCRPFIICAGIFL